MRFIRNRSINMNSKQRQKLKWFFPFIPSFCSFCVPQSVLSIPPPIVALLSVIPLNFEYSFIFRFTLSFSLSLSFASSPNGLCAHSLDILDSLQLFPIKRWIQNENGSGSIENEHKAFFAHKETTDFIIFAV